MRLTMDGIDRRERTNRPAAPQRATPAELSRRPAPATSPTTQWQRYLDRIRRLVRQSVHP
jgi:hypothetical protein